MPEFEEYNPPAEERIVVAIDTSNRTEAERLVRAARDAGVYTVKMGLEVSTALGGWPECGRLIAAINDDYESAEEGLEWIADAKLHDISNTTAGAMRNIIKSSIDDLMAGITIHAASGIESMRVAQELADEANVMVYAVTLLTSIEKAEATATYRMSPTELVKNFAYNAVTAGVEGLVCSSQELKIIKNDPFTGQLITLTPGVRSPGVDQGDQARVGTPEQAMLDGGDSVVIGRQLTAAPNLREAFEQLSTEMNRGLAAREAN